MYFCSYLTTKPLSNKFAKVLSEVPRDDQDCTPNPNTAVQINLHSSYSVIFMVQAQVLTERTNIFQARVPEVHHSASG